MRTEIRQTRHELRGLSAANTRLITLTKIAITSESLRRKFSALGCHLRERRKKFEEQPVWWRRWWRGRDKDQSARALNGHASPAFTRPRLSTGLQVTVSIFDTLYGDARTSESHLQVFIVRGIDSGIKQILGKAAGRSSSSPPASHMSWRLSLC